MDPIINNPDQQPIAWSARLGALAGSLPPRLQPNVTNLDGNTAHDRLSAILNSLRRREHAADTFRANHFILGD